MENNLEEKLGAILSDPDMMQKIQAMAQSLSQPAPQQPPPSQNESPSTTGPGIDFSTLQKLSTLTQQSGIDKNQQTLLSALAPYITRNKVTKLENAMRAAKMARLASTFLENGGLKMLTGR